jgi:hypothetical protein
MNYGSKGFRAQFNPGFATKTGFDNFKRANPKNPWIYSERDIDGDNIPEALVMTADGQFVAVNGMTQRESKWGTLGPYYNTRAQTQQAFDIQEGFRNGEGFSKISGIAKQWRNHYLKGVYDAILDPSLGSEEEIASVKETRKAFPLSKVAKFFINTLMDQEANRAIDTGHVDVSRYQTRGDALKAMKSTKKFKAYIADLALNAPKNNDYFFYLANIIRALIMNETSGGTDIKNTQGWLGREIPVDAHYVPPGTVRPPQASRGANVSRPPPRPIDEFIDRLEHSPATEISEEALAAGARLGIHNLSASTTNGQLLDAARQFALMT